MDSNNLVLEQMAIIDYLTRKSGGAEWNAMDQPKAWSTQVLFSVHHQITTKTKTLPMLFRAYTCVHSCMIQSLHSVYIPDHGEIVCVRSPDAPGSKDLQEAGEKRSREEPVSLSASVRVMRSWFQDSVLLTSKLVTSKGIGAETKGGSVGLSAGVGTVVLLVQVQYCSLSKLGPSLILSGSSLRRGNGEHHS
ncbi:hypothetical protein F2Q69_00056104 [Brassica cretica]|uniref:Uncharacterized protein n=1 Tax=Brassica cretica TaxID=69181 RepID=A0A8S9NAC1_BRACR|nr:hypothetical protein F2Q69_00056104 [Brassica cretica]